MIFILKNKVILNIFNHLSKQTFMMKITKSQLTKDSKVKDHTIP